MSLASVEFDIPVELSRGSQLSSALSRLDKELPPLVPAVNDLSTPTYRISRRSAAHLLLLSPVGTAAGADRDLQLIADHNITPTVVTELHKAGVDFTPHLTPVHLYEGDDAGVFAWEKWRFAVEATLVTAPPPRIGLGGRKVRVLTAADLALLCKRVLDVAAAMENDAFIVAGLRAATDEEVQEVETRMREIEWFAPVQWECFRLVAHRWAVEVVREK